MVDWKEIIEDLSKYGDIEAHYQNGTILRGPITAIEVIETYIIITAEWLAKQHNGNPNPNVEHWTLMDPSQRRIVLLNRQVRAGWQGSIIAQMPKLGEAIIFTRKDRLDPRLVQGHSSYDPRFRALNTQEKHTLTREGE